MMEIKAESDRIKSERKEMERYNRYEKERKEIEETGK